MKKLAVLVLMVAFSSAPIAYAQDVSTDSSPPQTPPASTDTSVPSTGLSAPDTSAEAAPDTASATDNPSQPADQPTMDTPAPDTSALTDTSPLPDTSPTETGQAATDTASGGSAPGTDVSVQDTANTQTTVPGSSLENTSDPQASTSTVESSSVVAVEASTSPQTVPVAPDAATSTADSASAPSAATATDGVATSTDAASTTQADAATTSAPSSPSQLATDATANDQTIPIQSDQSLDIVAQNVDQTPPPNQQTQRPAPVPISIPKADLAPKPEYAFVISGASIPVDHKDTASSTPLSASADNSNGTISVSGSCSDTYFVVLLFQNKDDYANDPSSYILNRAYPCQGGVFNYSISELPPSLPNGTYYLLIGQEGDRGSWKPITDLTAITINKN